jgi:molecular chaperone DnaK
MASNKVLGIDLGTTNSACAVLEGGEPFVVPNNEGNKVTPSVAAITHADERLVGEPAVNQVVQNPNRTVSSIKRKMGRPGYEVNIGNDSFTPEEISAIILRKIKEDAEGYLDEEIEDAVVTVPAYFTDSQRKATKNAGEIAGLNVKRIVNEPTAAAMAYGLDKNREQTVLVTDLGGGTFDVSILELGGGVCDVQATSGERYLGGDDWDQALVDHFAERFKSETGVDLKNNTQALKRLQTNCEELKKELSNRLEGDIRIPFIATTDDGPVHLEDSITREKFKEITTN